MAFGEIFFFAPNMVNVNESKHCSFYYDSFEFCCRFVLIS